MEKKLGIMFLLFVLLLLQFSELIRTAQRPLQGDNEEDKGNKNDNWPSATSEMAQEFSHVQCIFTYLILYPFSYSNYS
ncbi:Phytosulfokine [Arabidopsis suecica]|uniref:Phytosulfokine n=1 Tax=Arabidopsis suecica TaxID=45249 RepID=A0A8T1Z4W7_ARASU|nr:Phytosulfokine [Arabidopsis suecica]